MRVELDSHADTCVVGNSCALITHDFDRPVRVFGYDGTLGEAKPCKTVSAVVAYDDPSGVTYMLVLNQAILVERMKSVLLSTSQVREHGVRINDEPKHLVLNPTEDHHCIQIPLPSSNQNAPALLRVPLSMTGVISYFPVRRPSLSEYEQCPLDCVLAITSEEPEWDPDTTRLLTLKNPTCSVPTFLVLHLPTLLSP